MAASHAFEMLKQSLETELSTMNKRKAAATAEQAATQKSVAADTAALEDLKFSCSSKAAEWAARQKSAGEEIAAIDKAKEILSEGVKVFLQVQSRRATKGDAGAKR